GLAVFAEPLLASMALGGAVVVLLATAAALTLVPALLALAGRRVPPAGARTWVTDAVDAVRAAVRRALRRAAPQAGARRSRPRLLARLAAFAQRRPGPVALWVVVGLLLLAAPFLGANLQNSDARALPHSNQVRQAYDALQRDFNNSQAAPVSIFAEVDPGRTELVAFLNELERLPQVHRLEVRMDVAPGFPVVD